MTIEEIKVADAELLETRSKEILEENKDGLTAEDLEARALEAEAIEERRKELIALEEERKAKAEEIAKGNLGTIKEKREEDKKMSNIEVRNSAEYISAFANYIKTGKDEECRSLLTETVNGVVPVPVMVEDIIKTAWDEMPILSKVTRTNFAGNIKVGFERSATDAVYHTEGEAAPTEETLLLGIVELVPETIKKWITISDEALEQNPVSLLEYIYREIAHKIFKKAEDEIVARIIAAPTTATATAPSRGEVTITTIGLGDIIDAVATLSDEANNLYAIMSKATEASYKKLAIAANYAIDPFAGVVVLHNDTVEGVIVGDLKGVQANFVNGNDVTFKYDDLSLAEKDLVKVVGRLPIAIEVVADKRFAVVKTAGDDLA